MKGDLEQILRQLRDEYGYSLEQILRQLRDMDGYSRFYDVCKKLSRERLLNPNRDKRIKFPAFMYQKLFDKQFGLCPLCDEPLIIPAKRNHIDHADVSETKFNKESNLQLLHPKCNLSKSSKTLLEMSKETGKTIEELLP